MTGQGAIDPRTALLLSRGIGETEARAHLSAIDRAGGDTAIREAIARVVGHDAVSSVLALIAAKAQQPEWEYGAGYEADNGIEMRWFSMGGAAYTVREAAESEVARFDDPQIRLVRRTRPGPWVPVGEGEQ